MPTAAVLFTVKAPFTVVSLTTLIVLANCVLPITVKVLPVIEVFVVELFPNIDNAVIVELDFKDILFAVTVVFPFIVVTALAFNVDETISTLLVTLSFVPLMLVLVAFIATLAALV